MSSTDPSPWNAESTRHPRRSPSWVTMFGVWTIVFLLVWSVVRSTQPAPLHDPDFKARTVVPRGDLPADERDTIDVFRTASPSVVFITSVERRPVLFGFNVLEIPRGSGSGFIYDTLGHIVTNFHVIYGADILKVTLADGSEWDAAVVGREPDKDLAVLKIDAPSDRLQPITLGRSNDLQVGQKVLAIGNPFGFDQTLTVGVVSALGREIESLSGRKIRGVIQTDAAINPGNSGGPLLDSAGRLIGVNTQIASPSGASAGIGFAVPVDIALDIVPDIIRYGRAQRPTLGIDPVPDHITRRLRISGILIETVADGSGAANAGLHGTLVDRRGYIRSLGDVIIKVDGQPVRTQNELKDVLEPHKAGDVVVVTYVREDGAHEVKVSLQYIN